METNIVTQDIEFMAKFESWVETRNCYDLVPNLSLAQQIQKSALQNRIQESAAKYFEMKKLKNKLYENILP